MLVGALCRDVLHRRLGHTFTTTATQDLDLGLALSSWESYLSLAAAFPAVRSETPVSASASPVSTSTFFRSGTWMTLAAPSSRLPGTSR